MKNKGLIIMTIILLSIITLFLTIFLVIYLKGGKNFKGITLGLGAKSSKMIYDNEFDIESISRINIKQDAGNIIIKETSNSNIQVELYGDDEADAQVNLHNSELNIDNTHKKVRFFGGTKNDIIIYIPATYSNEINVKNNYGECEIGDLENATIIADCDAGNVELGKIKNATIKCDYGNVEIKEVLNKCDIKANCR